MTTLAPTYDFRGHPVRRLTYRGERAFLGREIGAALGYDRGGKRFVSQFTTEWAGEIRENVHWFRAKGDELKALKAQMSGAWGFAGELVLLTERGVTMALFRSGRPCAFGVWTWLTTDVLLPEPTGIREGVLWYRVKGADPREIKASLRLGAGTAPTRGGAAPSGDAALDAGAEPGGPAPAPSRDQRRAEAELAGRADAEVLTAALYALAAAKGIPLKADSKELLAAFRASFAEHGEVLLVDGMPDPTFTEKCADLGGEGLLAPASKSPRRPS